MNIIDFFFKLKLTPIEDIKKSWKSYTALLELRSSKQKLEDFEILIKKMSIK